VNRGETGDYVPSSLTGQTAKAFVPRQLPPEPPLAIDAGLRERLDQALLALGRLDSISALLPSPDLFLYGYIRKEAVLSSQIEGTQSSLSDLLLFELPEAPGVPVADAADVSRYVIAMEHGLERIRGGFPLSSRLIRELHGILLKFGRGARRAPGEFRRAQNWIGGTTISDAVFVPPPPERVEDCMAALERWLHNDPEPTPVLLKAALGHAQFETIHPFLDGNGRVGRLLVTLLLCSEGVLHEPLLYLSIYFKRHRTGYYDLLQRIRVDGDWESWVAFFADGVRETADEAIQTAKRIQTLFDEDYARIQVLGRRSASATQVHEALKRSPVRSSMSLAPVTGLSVPTINATLSALADLGIVREITGRKRNRAYRYEAYVQLLSEGTEPL
jgi:Fic family protein